MPKMTLQTLGSKLAEKRGDRALRDVAKEIKVSPATLSRVERGNLPDLETFGKICRWLSIDPGEILGVSSDASTLPMARVHFRKKKEVNPRTAEALAQLIVHAQRTLLATEGDEEETLI